MVEAGYLNHRGGNMLSEHLLPKGYWDKALIKAHEIGKTHMCPFQAFAEKHGYDLTDGDILIFPRSAAEFQEREAGYHGVPYGGYTRWHGVAYCLPNNVYIDYVSTRDDTYADRVMLVKWMQLPVDASMFKWELIKKPWPIGSHCEFHTKIEVVQTKPVLTAYVPPEDRPKELTEMEKAIVKSYERHYQNTSIMGRFMRQGGRNGQS
jgi:hypothetical protein